MVSVRYSRSVLHKNSIQESVPKLFPGLALEKIVECDGVWFAPRERVHPPLMPGERPRCSKLGDEADHLAFFLPAAARRMNSAAPRFFRPMYAARALGLSAPSFLSCVASLLNFDFFFINLPCGARPMPRGCLICRSIAVVPRSEALPPLRIVLLDLHVRISEANPDHGTLRIANVHRPLLRFARCIERFAKRDLLTLVLSHIKIGIAVNPAIL